MNKLLRAAILVLFVLASIDARPSFSQIQIGGFGFGPNGFTGLGGGQLSTPAGGGFGGLNIGPGGVTGLGGGFGPPGDGGIGGFHVGEGTFNLQGGALNFGGTTQNPNGAGSIQARNQFNNGR